ncbi:MAG: alginate O-acetyltransferase AlgX-related protein [Thermodesulfobacteriota bacterium]
MSRIIAAVCVCLLLLPLALPQAMALLGVSQGPGAVENRLKTPLPDVSLALDDFGAYARQLVKAYAETFPFRDDMIRAGNVLKMRVFGDSPSKSVILGRDGWLFFNMEMATEDWLNLIPYTREDLENAVEVMRGRRDWLAARGIAMLVVIAPNKSSVYGEFLPPSYEKTGRTSRLDQLGEAMREAGIPFLDLRPALLEAKAVRRAYWKTDTHWNGWGAFAGSRAIVDALRQRFPAMPPLREEDYRVEEKTVPGGDLSEMLLLEKTLTEQAIDMVPAAPVRSRPAGPKGWRDPATLSGRGMIIRETGDPSLPKAVFLRDSFCSAAWPFLAERFSRSVFLWEHKFQPRIIELEKPGVVVFEAVERYQHALFPPRAADPR